jgi:MoCo/4Fe-4S cofactor protein with predicted Tat translocation signal
MSGFDPSTISRRLAGQTGRVYWRSLEELADTPGFAGWVGEEFPGLAQAFAHALDRRHVLRMIGASLSLAGLASCSPAAPDIEMAVPVEEPGLAPGSLRHYATATTLGGIATGVLVTHADARPIKIEGNPDHPASLGATSAFDQAALLQLYDPDRMASVTRAGIIATPGEAFAALRARLAALSAAHGAGLRILSGAFSSPTLAGQRAALLEAHPDARWHVHEPASRSNVRRGAALAFGRVADAIPALDRADVILAIESDLLSAAPGHLAFARTFADRRRAAGMNRLYAIEATPTLTGAAADHRFVAAPSDIFPLLRQLAALLGGDAGGDAPAWLAPLAQDLAAHRGRALLHVGPEQPAETHALAHLLNHALSAPVRFIAPVIEPEEPGLAELVADIAAGRVDTLIMLGGDPAYSAPGDLGFAEALDGVAHRFHLAPYANATAAASEWVVPEAHELESWGDARAFDGTVTIQQPQLRPLQGGYSAHQLLSLMLGSVDAAARAPVIGQWRAQAGAAGRESDFDRWWSEALRSGVVAGSAHAKLTLAPQISIDALSAPSPADGLRLLFRPDAALWDGRFANNGWLQELPRPLTTLTWDNAALISPADAQRLDVACGDVVRLSAGGTAIEAPMWVLPGQAAGAVTLPLGYGQQSGGRIATGVGFDAYRLRRTAALWQIDGAAIAKTGRRVDFAATQHQPGMQGRDLLREVGLAELAEAAAAWNPKRPELSLYPPQRRDGPAWGMAIDLSRCLGCGACAVACQAENNVPIVGKEEVRRGRVMHWLRIDRYYEGAAAQPRTMFQPVLCMHCENAPCEVVCPVDATVHDREGLNVMVYNRCIGTRFCSNNCPYKVRRFNFFDYAAAEARPAAARNPDVTVRSRGVMEKCTYCLQRIKTAEIAAERDGRALRDGEIVTACQAACAARAISFGDIGDPASAVAAAKANPLDYALLGELGTRPRTSYAARLTNRNPAIGDES